MEKQEIVDLFLGYGYQLDLDSLEYFYQTPDGIRSFLEKLGETKTNPKTITLEVVRALVEKPGMDVELISGTDSKQTKNTVQSYVQHFTTRYEKISKLLLKRLGLLNLMSIGKISPRAKNFSIIGIVREKDNVQKTVVLEDQTGELLVYFDDGCLEEFRQILPDEVLGVVCEKKETVGVKKVIWPNLSLKKDVSKTAHDVYCAFLSDLHMDNAKFNKTAYEKFLDWVGSVKYKKFYIFVLGDVSSKKDDIKNLFSDLPQSSFKIFLKGEMDPDVEMWDLVLPTPSFIRLENSVSLLLCHGEFLTNYSNIWKDLPPTMVMLNLLKKRHINPVFEFNPRIYEHDPFLLGAVPDIFVSGHFHIPSLMNYKGTTIMSTGSFVSSPSFWLVNLRTRETLKLDFI